MHPCSVQGELVAAVSVLRVVVLQSTGRGLAPRGVQVAVERMCEEHGSCYRRVYVRDTPHVRAHATMDG
jgi:hypothetical protein